MAGNESDDGYDGTRGPSAPVIMLSSGTTLTSVELPGPAAEDSLPRVVDLLGGSRRFAEILQLNTDEPSNVKAQPELQLRPEDAFAHPPAGSVVHTSNLLFKVTRRRRKRRRLNAEDGEVEGLFTIEHAGNINRTLRFRDINDYQYAAPTDDLSVQLSAAMRNLDVAALSDFAFPEPTEESIEALSLVPPTIFSRIALPQWYGYKRNAQTKVEQVTNAAGEEHERLRNTSRYALVAPQAISWDAAEVPTKPPPGVKEGVGTEPELIARITELLEERPMWSRLALLNKLTPDQHRNVLYNKQALPYLTYTFSDGPFRELVCRFGWDPRKDPAARLCQRVQLRNTAERSSKSKGGPAVTVHRANNSGTDAVNRKSHIFDGEDLHTAVGTYQLCDLVEPMLQGIVRESRFFRSKCHPVDGWYVADFMDHLRNILKQKYMGLTNNEPVADEDLIADVERMRALPVEGDGGSGRDEAEDDTESEGGAGSETGTKQKTSKNPNAPKKKDLKKKPKPKPRASDQRELPTALKAKATQDEDSDD